MRSAAVLGLFEFLNVVRFRPGAPALLLMKNSSVRFQKSLICKQCAATGRRLSFILKNYRRPPMSAVQSEGKAAMQKIP